MTSTPTIPRPAPSVHRRRPQHRRGRRVSPHALQLRQVWRPHLSAAARVGVATESYVMHVVLWCALLAVLALGLALDTHAAVYGAATLTGFFRRRAVEGPVEESVEERPPSGPASPVVHDDPLVDPDDGLGVPVLAADDDPPPPERTDVIPAVRRAPARRVEASPVATLERRNARLVAELAERDRVIGFGTEQLEQLREQLRTAELDRAEADNAARVLREALDRDRPAPDARELAERLRAVYMLPTSYSSDTEVRWRRVAQAAIDAVRGLWPIERWPLTDDERRGVTAAQRHRAERAGWPHNSPGGGAEVADSPPAVTPPAPGDTNTALSAAAEAHLEALARTIARRDLEVMPEAMTGGAWPRLSDLMREHYRAVAAEVVEAGWRPPLDNMLVPRGRRALLARVLVDHEQLPDGACRCGWAGVAIWHAEHVAEQLLATGVAR